jgi:hypothetical protein
VSAVGTKQHPRCCVCHCYPVRGVKLRGKWPHARHHPACFGARAKSDDSQPLVKEEAKRSHKRKGAVAGGEPRPKRRPYETLSHTQQYVRRKS